MKNLNAQKIIQKSSMKQQQIAKIAIQFIGEEMLVEQQ